MTEAIQQQVDVPAAPTTPAEAQARLSQAKQDPTWRDGLLAGNPKELGEFKSLHALIDRGDNHDLAIAGQFAPGDVQTSDHLQNMGTAAMLADAGIEPSVIKQVLTNGSVSREEFDKAASVKAMLMKSSEFTAKLMANDGEAKRSWKLLNIILSSDVKQAAA